MNFVGGKQPHKPYWRSKSRAYRVSHYFVIGVPTKHNNNNRIHGHGDGPDDGGWRPFIQNDIIVLNGAAWLYRPVLLSANVSSASREQCCQKIQIKTKIMAHSCPWYMPKRSNRGDNNNAKHKVWPRNDRRQASVRCGVARITRPRDVHYSNPRTGWWAGGCRKSRLENSVETFRQVSSGLQIFNARHKRIFHGFYIPVGAKKLFSSTTLFISEPGDNWVKNSKIKLKINLI